MICIISRNWYIYICRKVDENVMGDSSALQE